jgi:hypothetical protein
MLPFQHSHKHQEGFEARPLPHRRESS